MQLLHIRSPYFQNPNTILFFITRFINSNQYYIDILSFIEISEEPMMKVL